MKIDVPITSFRAAIAVVLFSALWLLMIYMGEHRWDVLGALQAGLCFGGLFWFGMSLISSRGLINKLLHRAGLIGGQDKQ